MFKNLFKSKGKSEKKEEEKNEEEKEEKSKSEESSSIKLIDSKNNNMKDSSDNENHVATSNSFEISQPTNADNKFWTFDSTVDPKKVFTKLKVLGKGGFGTVLQIVHRPTIQKKRFNMKLN